MQVEFPYQIDATGRTAATSEEKHVRDMIEQLLFTRPGERVNRPDFGSGLDQLVFAPNSPELAAALQVTVQAALQQWLGDRIELEGVRAEAVDARLSVTVAYRLRGGETQTAVFTQET